jgi:alkylated DNA nucleotide flippase Atl1
MGRIPVADAPWWRVVARSGRLPVAKRDPRLAMEQRDRLIAEGVPFVGDDVAPEAFWDAWELS